jgi:hypothetical protein
MTTVAYRDGVLAADTLSVSAGIPCRCTKLFRLEDGSVCGFAGNVDAWRLFLAWLRHGGEPPKFTDKDRESFHALVMHPDGRVDEWESERVAIPLEDPFYAIGSGSKAAVAAMHMGADAARAIEIAKLCDADTGGPVMVMRCAR